MADKDKDNKDDGTDVTAEQARAEVKNLIAETVAEELGKFDFGKIFKSAPTRTSQGENAPASIWKTLFGA